MKTRRLIIGRRCFIYNGNRYETIRKRKFDNERHISIGNRITLWRIVDKNKRGTSVRIGDNHLTERCYHHHHYHHFSQIEQVSVFLCTLDASSFDVIESKANWESDQSEWRTRAIEATDAPPPVGSIGRIDGTWSRHRLIPFIFPFSFKSICFYLNFLCPLSFPRNAFLC